MCIRDRFYSELNARRLTLELRDGALAVKNGKVLRALDGRTFALNTGTFAFSGPDQFVARYEGGDTVQFRRVMDAPLEPAALAAYAGSYRSEEVPATYQVSVDGARLAFRVAAHGGAAGAAGALGAVASGLSTCSRSGWFSRIT